MRLFVVMIYDNSSRTSVIRFSESGMVKEIKTFISCLRRENGSEVVYTQEGHRIMVNDILSVNGVAF
jgi:hypothetical protein